MENDYGNWKENDFKTLIVSFYSKFKKLLLTTLYMAKMRVTCHES